jgi:hypothetical protein
VVEAEEGCCNLLLIAGGAGETGGIFGAFVMIVVIRGVRVVVGRCEGGRALMGSA